MVTWPKIIPHCLLYSHYFKSKIHNHQNFYLDDQAVRWSWNWWISIFENWNEIWNSIKTKFCGIICLQITKPDNKLYTVCRNFFAKTTNIFFNIVSNILALKSVVIFKLKLQVINTMNFLQFFSTMWLQLIFYLQLLRISVCGFWMCLSSKAIQIIFYRNN